MFILLPVGMDYRARRYPVVTFTIMGICTAIYLIGLFYELSGDAKEVQLWELNHLWLIPDRSVWWTYITSVFVHGGFWHLFGNMIYLFLFGSCVEDIIGRLHFTIFYLLCGIGAAFAYILFSPEHFASHIPMGGASGAISGCIGGYLLLRARAHIQFKWISVFRLAHGDFSMPAWAVISFWFLKDLALMLLANQLNTHGGGVAFGAHVGGTLVGAGLIALEKIRLKRMPQEVEEEETPVNPLPVIRKEPAAWAAPRARTDARAIPLRPMPALAAVTSEVPSIQLSWNGEQFGPFTASQIRQMFASGEIPDVAYYWQEGMSEWRNAEELR